MGFRKLSPTGHTPSLVTALLYFEFSFMVWVSIGALGPYIAASLGLTSFQKGLIVAVPALGGTIFRLVLGSAADRWGVRRTGICAAAFTLVPLAWGWLGGDSLSQLIGIGFFLGIAGASFAVALPLASRWYPPGQQGVILGIVGAGNSGTVLSAFLMPRLAEVFGWHGVFGLAMAPIALAASLLAGISQEPPNKPSPSGLTASVQLLRDSDARWLCALYAMTFGGFVGFISYLPIYLVDSYGVSKVSAGMLATGCGLAGSLVRPLGGWIADRIGGATFLPFLLGAAAAFSLVLSIGPGLPVTLGCLSLMLASHGMGNGAVFQLVPQRFADSIGAATGLIGAAGGLGGFLLPLLLGSVRALTGSYSLAFGTWMTVCAVASIALVYRRRVWISEWQPQVSL